MIALIIIVVIILLVATSRCRCGCMKIICAWRGCCRELMVNSRRYVTLHYTNWCRYCKEMKPVYERVKHAVAGSGVIFREIDEDIAATPGITKYPTILMLDEDGHRYTYVGPADFEQLRRWIVTPEPTTGY